MFELLGNGLAQPEFRGCPFINTAAEYPDPDSRVASAIVAHRRQVHDLFIELLMPLPARRRRDCADQLVLVYDGALAGAQLDNGANVARMARRAAQRLVAANV